MKFVQVLGLFFLLIVVGVIENSAASGVVADNLSNINASDPVAWYNKGEALYNLSKYNESLEAYNKAIELNQSYAAAWSRKGAALRGLGKYNESLKAYDRAIELDPIFE
jgi:tetratricopeptide (TPR) repeat protein